MEEEELRLAVAVAVAEVVSILVSCERTQRLRSNMVNVVVRESDVVGYIEEDEFFLEVLCCCWCWVRHVMTF